MPKRCVVFGCSEAANSEKGISVHFIPYFGDDKLLSVNRRKKWTDFVARTRKNWKDTQSSAVCSKHFIEEDFERSLGSAQLPGFGRKFLRTLRRDKHGICAFPTIYPQKRKQDLGLSSTSSPAKAAKPSRDRAHRQIIRDALRKDVHVPSTQVANVPTTSSASIGNKKHAVIEQSACDEADSDISLAEIEPVNDFSTQTESCVGCRNLTTENKRLNCYWLHAKLKLDAERKETARLHAILDNSSSHHSIENELDEFELETTQESEDIDVDKIMDESCSVDIIEDDDYIVDEDNDYIEEDENEEGLNETITSCQEDAGPKDVRTETKVIVFLSQLLLLFRVCPACKQDGLLAEVRVIGTMAEIASSCANPNCKDKERLWRSQPDMPGTRIPAGNFLLSFAILVAGASATKIRTVFSHMGLSCISLSTYFSHQKEKLFPAIYIHWKKYQCKLLLELNSLGEKLVITGDARHDSMGHCAKYGIYSIFCCNKPSITHFELVQRNEVENSPAMEYEGFKRSMAVMMDQECGVSTFVSDRHSTVLKHMKEHLSSVTHYFDLWHLKKKVRKILSKMSKLKGFDILKEWIQPCVNHLHWSATTTFSGDGNLILAKFKSFLGHIVNKHDGLDDPLFSQCAHSEDIAQRKWLKEDSDEFEKLAAALSNKRLQNGIQQASPIAQTSCLEGFHSVVNHFCPKMLGFSYVGMLCRHALAALHFNNNLTREVKVLDDGSSQVSVHYPKFKNGEATVKDVRVSQNFDYVGELFTTTINSIREQSLEAALIELKRMTPPPLCADMDKESREDALKKREARKRMDTQDVPGTSSVSDFVAVVSVEARPKKTPHCTVCKQPMKGHKFVTECPKNQE